MTKPITLVEYAPIAEQHERAMRGRDRKRLRLMNKIMREMPFDEFPPRYGHSPAMGALADLENLSSPKTPEVG